MVVGTMSRVDEILAEIQEDIARRRAAGHYGAGYEAGFEKLHNEELGKIRPPEKTRSTEIVEHLDRLRGQISSLSEIERDTTRFRPLRFVRELAMSRHQLIRLNREVRSIAESIESIAQSIVSTEADRTNANERAAQELLDRVYERTMVMERLWVVVQELEERVNKLESGPA